MEDELYPILAGFFREIADHLEDYIETFLRIYQEADQSADFRRQIAALHTQVQLQQQKQEKLLELYMDSTITKAEFSKRNTAFGRQITELENEIRKLEQQTVKDAEYAKGIKRIRRCFETMYDPKQEMTRLQIDEMIKAVIDHIDVVPVNEKTMKLEIKLQTGENGTTTYVRTGSRYGRRSGPISNEMMACAVYINQFKFDENRETHINNFQNFYFNHCHILNL